MDKVNFSDWLISEMKKREWTQSDLARKADMNRQVISMYVNRKRINPDAETLKRLAAAFDVPIETAYRAAGLFPDLPTPRDLYEEKLIYLAHQLDDVQVRQTIQYIEFLLNYK